ncbi:threonine ammonia-lyase, partial [Streptomyces xanthophaeus]
MKALVASTSRVSRTASCGRYLSSLTGSPVHFKCENLQRTGSFKLRGAYV